MELNTLALGDCLTILPTIQIGSVDMILCDLPQGITKNEWDIPIDLPAMWAQCKRVTNDRAAIVLFSNGTHVAQWHTPLCAAP